MPEGATGGFKRAVRGAAKRLQGKAFKGAVRKAAKKYGVKGTATFKNKKGGGVTGKVTVQRKRRRG